MVRSRLYALMSFPKMVCLVQIPRSSNFLSLLKSSSSSCVSSYFSPSALFGFQSNAKVSPIEVSISCIKEDISLIQRLLSAILLFSLWLRVSARESFLPCQVDTMHSRNRQVRSYTSNYSQPPRRTVPRRHISLKERIPQTADRIEELQASISNVTRFIHKAKIYTEINELSGELLNIFIEKIEAEERAGNHYSLPRHRRHRCIC
jgi:hypothetical protein